MPVNTHLVLPELIGARDSAVALANTLPPELHGLEVTVDASQLRSASEGFADELVRQVIGVRDAASLAVGESTRRFAEHLRTSAARRGFEHRLVIDCREMAYSAS